MTSMRIGIKNKLQSLGLSPSKDRPPKGPNDDNKKVDKPKKMNYKKKLKTRWNLTDEQFDKEKREAMKQTENWQQYRIERTLEIFQTKSTYVSKSVASDVKHPKVLRATKVVNRQGQVIDVEFGRTKDWFLMKLAPDKKFIEIRRHSEHAKDMKGAHEKQERHFAKQGKGKQADRLKSQAQFDQLINGFEEDGEAQLDEEKTAMLGVEKEAEQQTAIPEKFAANTTDDRRSVFPDTWYQLAMSRSQMAKGSMIYWVSRGGGEDDEIDDDPDNKYTVTAERIIEVLTAGGKVKDSGVEEPTAAMAKNSLKDPLDTIYARYKKTSGRDACFTNTLKGTIEFSKKQIATEEKTEKTNNTTTTNTITQDVPTDLPNQITFAPTVIAHVFKGNRMKRQFKGKNAMETYTEDRKDFKREAGEETSGI